MTVLRVAMSVGRPASIAVTVLVFLTAGFWLAAWSAMGQADMLGILRGLCLAIGLPADGFAAPATAAAFAPVALMWLLMMGAMMLPAMTPMIATYAEVVSREDRGARLALRVGLFALGYFVLWAVTSLGFAVAQLALRDTGFFTGDAALVAAPLTAAGLLIIAGVYEFTNTKHACLTHCRQPMTFLLSEWRDGMRGAFPLGLKHGVYCVGCCIGFMGLMFVFGAMNLWWMAVIALYCLAEKIAPRAEVWGRVTGAVLLTSGVALLTATLI